ncbi:cholinesterase 1-like [Mytilus trossulus]|uniref:cholinesterase 1-like n=1 Tax=Mytilus trossulus TaxID=6551 RepID=UPI0030078DCF
MIQYHGAVLPLICILMCCLVKLSYEDQIVVSTRHGSVRGFSIPSHYSRYDNRKINIFLGVPYAKRLTQYLDWRREFRFNRPDKPSWSGTWDASYYRPACPQHMWHVKETVPGFNKQNVSEDCLYMNIFVPHDTDEIPSNSPTLYPVMVFIHGGGFVVGASQQYPGVFLAERKIVVVTFNYRLGPLGFLSTNSRDSWGNYGMWDQIRALEFVKENIEAFRGNPNLVTIAGQSTGAACVGLHLLSPRSNRLFVRAIMQSGSDLSEWAIIKSNDDAKSYAIDLAMEIGCPTGDMSRLVNCLQVSRTADEIVNASSLVRLKPASVGNPWGPVVDIGQGAMWAFLPETPRSMRSQERFKLFEVMAGLNRDDGSYFIPNVRDLEEGIESNKFGNIINEFLTDRNVEDLFNTKDALEFEYTWWPQPGNKSMIRQMLMDMMTDYMFGTGLDEVVKGQAKHNKTYVYNFNYYSWNDYLPPWRGIAHGQELQYMFGFPYINQTYKDLFGVYPRQQYDYQDRNISEYMISMWTNFTASGNPTPKTFNTLLHFKNVTWLQYNNFNHSYLEIGNTSRNLINYRQNHYGFWRKYFPQLYNRPNFIKNTGSSSTDDQGKNYQIATYSLVGLAVLLSVIVLSLCIAVYRRRPKDY